VIIDVVAAIIREDHKILITQRMATVHLAKLWEFPGGKVEPGETFEDALRREILEELGIRIHVGDEFFTVDHEYPAKAVRLHFFNCSIAEGEARALQVADLRWVAPQQLDQYAFPPADSELIAKLSSC
jgi:8-oxo-dGTP diphosphatase